MGLKQDVVVSDAGNIGTGQVNTMSILTPELESAFFARTRRTDTGCLEWTGGVNRNGYGQVRIGGKLYLCHRVSFEWHYGPISPGVKVRHRCDNPSCIERTHLLPGSQSDNIADCIERGRRNQAFGERMGTSKLREADIIRIREMGRAGAASGRAIARMFGVSHTMVQDILARRNWKHLGGPE
jgi:hypothetical protein